MQFSCELCGSTSNSGLASFQEKLWREGHTCARRKRPVDAELAELQMRAKRFKPIPLPSPGNWKWKDSLRSDPWGAPPSGNQLLRTAWSNGQCLQACIGSLLNADVRKVPDPQISYDAGDDWHDHYNARLEKATGSRIDFLPASTCPPKNANQLWIAGFEEDDGGGHAVIARGHFIVHDPAGLHHGNVPMDRLVDGMIVRLARRVVPVFSMHGRHGHAVISA
jgi:hypothetical protein